MILARLGAPGAERPALFHDGAYRDLSAHMPDLAGVALSDASLDALRALDPASLPPVAPDTRIGPCVGGVGKIVCIGLNYSDHADEIGLPIPTEPIVFLKPSSAICGPNDPLRLPPGAEKTDWEVELAIVIGTHGTNIDPARSFDHVAGYCVMNDVSERAWQFERGGSWDKGKAADTFAPLGPHLVTRDAVPDPQALGLWTRIDDTLRQNGRTDTMIFGVAEVIAYVSRFMSLHPGDIIATGTPPGVGASLKPEPQFLRAGQVMRCGIDGLGEQRQVVVGAD